MALYGKNYLYDNVWHCMAKNGQKVYDNVWHCMAFLKCMAKLFLLQNVRHCMALYGIFKMYDNVWHCMAKMNEMSMTKSLDFTKNNGYVGLKQQNYTDFQYTE